MCLTKLKSQRKAIKRLFKDRKEITCYKVLNYNMRPIFYSGYRYQPGINVPDTIVQNNNVVTHSLHVYTTRQKAIEAKLSLDIILPVKCRRSNLVAVGNNKDATFSKLRIRKRDWEAAKKRQICTM